jgi:hypothetical protein
MKIRSIAIVATLAAIAALPGFVPVEASAQDRETVTPAWRSQYTLTCCATPAATRWSMRPRHATHSGLARPPIDPAHDALHAIERGAVQGLLEVGAGLFWRA